MYRATSYILLNRKILHYRTAIDFQNKAISRSAPCQKYKKPTERETCPPLPPPPPPPPKDDKLLWGALSVLVLAGSFAVYAKQNPDVRDWLSLYAPWFDDLIAIVYKENMTYGEYAEQCYDNMKRCLTNYISDPKPKRCSIDRKLIEEDEFDEAPKVSKCDANVEQPKCEVKPPPVITKDICEVDKCLRDLGDVILNNYLTAREACAYYNKLAEDTMVNFEFSSFKELRAALIERQGLVKTSTCNVTETTQQWNELSRYLTCGVQAPKDAIEATKGMLNDYQDKIAAARMQFLWENDKSIALDNQIAKVEELVTNYTDENQTLFSGLRYDQKKPVLQGDADLLLYHTMRYAARLQEELQEASSNMTERVNRALEILPQGEKELKARCSLLSYEIKKRRADMDRQFKQRYEDQRTNNERILKESLRKQNERHEEILEMKLAQKEREITKKLNKMVNEKVASEKKVFAELLSEMAAKLKVVEDKLNARLKAERETRRSQELWAAGASLLAATKKGDPIVKVDKELKAIEKASGDDDKLVKTVLKSIPDKVRNDGIVPESVLRERYHKMEKASLAVALVEAEGGPLPIYILSWFQSLMLFMKLSCIPQAEIDKTPQEPSKDLDTFDILRRARYYIEHGNLAAAVRYVESLQGASRAAASTWYDAAQSHLEARQAAEAVLAHAAALGLQYI